MYLRSKDNEEKNGSFEILRSFGTNDCQIKKLILNSNIVSNEISSSFCVDCECLLVIYIKSTLLFMTEEAVKKRLFKARHFNKRYTIFITCLWLLFAIFCLYQFRYGSYEMQLTEISQNSQRRLQKLVSQINAEMEKEYMLIEKLNQAQETIETLQEESDVENLLAEITQQKAGDEESVSSSKLFPLLIITHKRADYLKRCLDTVFRYLPKSGFHVIVSQDGHDPHVARIIQSYGDKLTHLQV